MGSPQARWQRTALRWRKLEARKLLHTVLLHCLTSLHIHSVSVFWRKSQSDSILRLMCQMFEMLGNQDRIAGIRPRLVDLLVHVVNPSFICL